MIELKAYQKSTLEARRKRLITDKISKIDFIDNYWYQCLRVRQRLKLVIYIIFVCFVIIKITKTKIDYIDKKNLKKLNSDCEIVL